MKQKLNKHEARLGRGESLQLVRPVFSLASLALLLVCASISLPPASAAPAPPHGIAAANITVVQLGYGNDPSEVIVTNSYAFGEFNIRTNSNRADYYVQVGPESTNDMDLGILMSSVTENGRDNFDPIYPGTNFCTSFIE